MDVYAQTAIKRGLAEICFLDHLTLNNSGKALSMTIDEVPLYFQAARIIKDKYAGKLEVKTGLEMDFHPQLTDVLYEVSSRYAFDVIGSSVHFVGDINIVSHASAWKLETLDPDHLYEGYLSMLTQMLDYDYFDVVCHLDLVKKFIRPPTRSFAKEFRDILSIIKQKRLTVEINTSGYIHPVADLYPSADLIGLCAKMDIPITLGSDAHRPGSVGQSYDRVLPIIRSAGYNHLSSFTHRKPYPIETSSAHTPTAGKDI